MSFVLILITNSIFIMAIDSRVLSLSTLLHCSIISIPLCVYTTKFGCSVNLQFRIIWAQKKFYIQLQKRRYIQDSTVYICHDLHTADGESVLKRTAIVYVVYSTQTRIRLNQGHYIKAIHPFRNTLLLTF